MLKTLLKKQFKETAAIYSVGMNAAKGKKALKKRGGIGYIILWLFVAFSLCMAFIGISHLFIEVLYPASMWLYYAILGIMAMALGVIGSAVTTFASLYKAKDNDLLLSLPIKSVDILLSRMLMVYILGTGMTFIGLLPSFFMNWTVDGFSFVSLIILLIQTVSMGFVVLALSCVLGWVVALISDKLKGKAITKTLITIAFLVLYYIFYFNINELLAQLAGNVEQAGTKIKSYAYIFYLFGKGCTGDWLSILIFLAISAALAALCVWVLSSNFIKLATSNSGEKKKSYISKKVKSKSVVAAVFKKEYKHFLSNSTYMVNCGLGAIFMLGAAVVLFIKRNDISMLYEILGEDIVSNFAPLLIMALACVFGSMNDLTAPCISLEGPSLWILRTSPASAKDILLAKILYGFSFSVIPTEILVITSCVILGVNIGDTVLIIISALLLCFLYSELGVLLDIKRPMFDWVNEVQPIKQSLQVLIMLFAGLPIGFVVCGSIYLLSRYIPMFACLAVGMVLIDILTLLVYIWLKKKGSRLWDTLQN